MNFLIRHKLTPFGRVSDPSISVVVHTPAGDRTYYFLLDTGADFSVVPRRLAHQLGLEWTVLPVARVVGVEQSGVQARLGTLPIRLGRLDLTIRCLFVDAPRVPFILGRADVLDRFILTINPAQQRIVLTALP